ncbi:hypothetical protein PFICI_07645 [Pestalotiopsis fici W106-1]|uniref:Myb-like domain-containing protein n=1 Tax=Pestalotiopsis fici (strain W106-1 / CGMCC3.15140) TaxID=1229662 RepID=W3X4L4_PESFW|nr:uncharacterized protein PFICI_07645 [Pestalotiopsis fici W106-1]ETS80116.1 hypothetical protein PFICI_07645 [Pestalotiopsis fici W106-1]
MADDDKDNARDASADPIRDNSQWTTDQDGAICKLKKDGLTWAAIAMSVGRKKNLVRQRFQFIRSQIEAAGLDTDSIGENWAEDMRRQGQEIPSPEKPIASSPPDEVVVVAEENKEDDQEQNKKIASPLQTAIDLTQALDECVKVVKQQAKQPVHARGGGGKKKKKKNNNKSSTSATPESGQIKLSGRVIERNGVRFAELANSSDSDSDSSGIGSTDSDDDFDHEAEREEQKRFVYHDYWSELYPEQKTYSPDRHWTEGDCKVLAVIEAKDEALKFKRMQADFFNATGRMVSEEVIKYKMQQAK